jgi:RNA polymerase sigma-70 factor (ECF subfamily)
VTDPSPQRDAARAALVRLVRSEGARVLATLVRITGDVRLAEDCVQDATVRALETWPRDGVPEVPRAWLVAAARHRAVDVVRRERARTPKEVAAVHDPFGAGPPDAVPPGRWGADPALADLDADDVVEDDLLRLVFMCCHPALAVDAQVALALRTLCGLTTAEVARALLLPEATARKRLTRAKDKIARAGIPFRVPAAADLPARVGGVAACVYLLFNEGYAATSGDDPLRADLVDEALRLGRLLVGLMPDEPALLGLLALMLLHDSRRGTRTDADGDLVLLADQDRAGWDRARITEGVVLVGDGLRRTPDRPDPYVVQAAIAACHALAPTFAATDWDAVVSWYDVLLTVLDTPVVQLNRAVAVGERDGPAAGLAAVEALLAPEAGGALAGYPLAHAARAELLARLGRDDEAATGYAAALALETNAATRRHLERRLQEGRGRGS